MIRNSEKTKKVMNGLEGFVNRLLAQSLTIEKVAEMEDEEFDLYRSLAKSYQEFSELSVAYSEQLDEQSEMLSSLQEDMKKMLEKK